MTLVRATIANIDELQDICIRAYTGNFKDHWVENGLELFLVSEFGDERLTKDLHDENLAYYFIVIEGQVRGFIKVDFNLPAEEYPDNSCELVKIYVLPEYKGRGFGSVAVKELIDMLQERGKENVFLYVIDSNADAIAFYSKMGFSYYGPYRLEAPLFREELRNMHCLRLVLESVK